MSDDLVGHMTKLIAVGLDRIEQLTAERDRLGRELNVAKYGQPDFAWSVHLAAMAEVQAERDRLRALPAVQPDALCECGMTGPCKWTECKAPILSAHVNETPKSEHDAMNMLKPAKGAA